MQVVTIRGGGGSPRGRGTGALTADAERGVRGLMRGHALSGRGGHITWRLGGQGLAPAAKGGQGAPQGTDGPQKKKPDPEGPSLSIMTGHRDGGCRAIELGKPWLS